VRDPQIHPDNRLLWALLTGGGWDGVQFDGDRYEPAAPLETDGRRLDPRGAGFDPAGQLARGLMSTHSADTGQTYMPAITITQPESTGGEPARQPGTFSFETREPNPLATRAPDREADQSRQCSPDWPPAGVGLFEFSRHHGAT
jgi:hypothetical protein